MVATRISGTIVHLAVADISIVQVTAAHLLWSQAFEPSYEK
jgi:hypothetical protein